jgi:hypothetical protein
VGQGECVLISTHVLSGALLGRALGRPLPALLVGAVSHLALDRLPHWGRGGGWPARPMQGEDLRVAVVDGLCGLGLLALAVRATPAAARGPVLAGIVGACLPDLDKPGLLWFGRSPWPEAFDRFHADLQVDVESPGLLLHDVVLAGGAAPLALALLRGRPRGGATS